jgi:hypothetical protein
MAPKQTPARAAKAGDRLIVRAHHQGEPERDAEILEVMGERDHPHYRVRWQDTGHETILYPGADVFVQGHAPTR